jgi:hypothetical protein
MRQLARSESRMQLCAGEICGHIDRFVANALFADPLRRALSHSIITFYFLFIFSVIAVRDYGDDAFAQGRVSLS